MFLKKVSHKGSVVIPKDIRKKYKIEPGTKVNIAEISGSIRIIPIPKDPITAARGFLKTKSKESLTSILLDERKKESEREERQL